jgi:hypothetical protein
VKSDWVDLARFELDGENGSECVVGGISFNNNGSVRNPMSQDGCGGECLLELDKGGSSGGSELKGGIFLGEAGERNGDCGIAKDETAIEVGKVEKGLNIFD